MLAVTAHPLARRPLVLGVLLAGALVLTALLVPAGPEPVAPPGRALAADRTAPLEVLRGWDRDRARAWRRGDGEALAELYVPGSRAGRADAALLEAYAGRGLRVTGVRMQLAAVEVVARTGDRLELLVTDRLGRTVARGGGGSFSLPGDDWSRRRVVMVRSGTRWQVAEVRDRAQARPEASTADTSGSSNR
ncbi:hypothetical protein [Nocardioides euryhalodurans]|uniref:Uncharacterized protein n=1 Tax=Nocardioides euryhalodurans TaxID=2518370 RepID=A0A4P7GHS8_9ACTN|nr:hypothetical protein [Nocardioides euryhalodurans]QBR91470.1 hypothetical protein EXE57_03705 [Nocardioides euryhalodurans]